MYYIFTAISTKTNSQTNVTQLLPPYTDAVSIFNRIIGEILQIFI